MSRAYLALCVALMLTASSGAVVTDALIPISISAAPGKVFDGIASTGADKDTWSARTNAAIGDGATSSTVCVYCSVIDGYMLSKVYSRTLNITLLSHGTARFSRLKMV